MNNQSVNTPSRQRRAAALPYALGLLLAASACAHAADRNAEAGQDRRARMDFGTCAKPEYPQAELAARHEGKTDLNFLVDPDGGIAASKVLHSSGHAALDEAARAALAECRFQPALVAGKPVRKWATVTYVWTLK